VGSELKETGQRLLTTPMITPQFCVDTHTLLCGYGLSIDLLKALVCDGQTVVTFLFPIGNMLLTL